ncbi:MAG: VOC family protein [Gammaproteobacteria bacterium]|nr:VOC family protein [Gammaproteobacteria bacterium]
MNVRRGGWCLALCGALLLCGAAAGRAQETPAFLAQSKGQIVGLAYAGRMVRDLERAIAFYRLLGFDPVIEGVDSSWRADPVMNRIHGTRNLTSRMAKFTIESAVSGQPFTLYLREYRGITRRDTTGGKTPWEPGAVHLAVAVPDPVATWERLRAAGMLWPRTWGGELIVRPGETRGSIAYLTDPDGMDLELFDRRPASLATTATAPRTGTVPAFDHIGIVVADIDLAKGFYGSLLGERFPPTSDEWLSGDFLDSATGGHGNVLRLHNGSFPEAADPELRLRFELVEYLNRRKPVAPRAITDIGISYVGFEVRDLASLLVRLQGAGAEVVSDGIVDMAGYKVVLVRDLDTGAFVQLFERPVPAEEGK